MFAQLAGPGSSLKTKGSHMRYRLPLIALFLLLTGHAGFATADAVSDLHALFDSAWERDLAENPLAATYLGDSRYDDRWPDLSATALERSHELDRKVLDDLARIPRTSLPAAEQLNYDLFEREYRNRIDAYPFKPALFAFTHRESVAVANELAELISFDSVKKYEDWIARLRNFGTYADQNVALLQQGLRERRTQPLSVMSRVPSQLAQQLVERPDDSPFFKPLRDFPDSINAAERERLAAAARAAISEAVIPAYRRMDRFFARDLLPELRKTDGVWDTTDGEAYYQNRIRYHTTTSLTADEIHEIGLKEVARIRGEMDRVIAAVGFKGSFQDFVNHLRTDPKFYYRTGDELFEAYLAVSKRIDPELVKLFGKLPRTPYGVRPIPMTSAPNTTTAYYQPPSMDGTRAGYYYVNLYRPEVRPKYEMEVLSVHEAVPGHHFQIALALEQGDLPLFRRNAGFTAYVEGWALYTESLGEDLGLYTDPYSKFGQLTYDMWRAVRLVVDTGIHHKRWTRQQAIDYFKANAAKTEADIVNEIDRYISWPGQALAYKIGQLKIRGLRAEAEQRLGAKFDVREFHDTVLASGAVPLDVLEKNVHGWIETRLAARPGGSATETVEEVERRRFAAMVAQDVAALEPMLAPELRYVHSNAEVEGKAQFLETIGSGRLRYLSIDVRELDVRRHGDAAIITGLISARGASSSGPVDLELRYTDAYVNRDGRWQLFAWQSTRIPPPQ
jgi:uncharacterized protein (DUF885 family)/ketosteroid isomerase-like protein